jgi:hypothetical protein
MPYGWVRLRCSASQHFQTNHDVDFSSVSLSSFDVARAPFPSDGHIRIVLELLLTASRLIAIAYSSALSYKGTSSYPSLCLATRKVDAGDI